jgi:exodeoxyribonuclease VII small subunit
MSDTTELTFEEGYERLQSIARRLNEDEVPVSEMCDLYAEGKGLEQALTKFLDEQRGRVEAIERGEGIRAFRISQTAGPAGVPDQAHDDGFVVGEPTLAPAPAPAIKPGATADDDIPF